MDRNSKLARDSYYSGEKDTGSAMNGQLYSSSLPEKRNAKRNNLHVHFHDCPLLSEKIIPIGANDFWSEAEKSKLWVQNNELASTLRSLSTLAQGVAATALSSPDMEAYTACVTETYFACCLIHNDEDDDEDELFVAQQIMSLESHGSTTAELLARGGATMGDNHDLHSVIRGLETQILPKLADECTRRRVEHVTSTVQLYETLCGTMPQQVDQITSAVAERLSRPSRRFAAVMGRVDAMVVQQQQQQEQQQKRAAPQPLRAANAAVSGVSSSYVPTVDSLFSNAHIKDEVSDDKEEMETVKDAARNMPSISIHSVVRSRIVPHAA